MAKKFPKSLHRAWVQYQDLYDRYMRLLKKLGEGDIEAIYKLYEAQIEFAMKSWQSPEARFEMGEYEFPDE